MSEAGKPTEVTGYSDTRWEMDKQLRVGMEGQHRREMYHMEVV